MIKKNRVGVFSLPSLYRVGVFSAPSLYRVIINVNNLQEVQHQYLLDTVVRQKA